jgi:hypothetical protein
LNVKKSDKDIKIMELDKNGLATGGTPEDLKQRKKFITKTTILHYRNRKRLLNPQRFSNSLIVVCTSAAKIQTLSEFSDKK